MHHNLTKIANQVEGWLSLRRPLKVPYVCVLDCREVAAGDAEGTVHFLTWQESEPGKWEWSVAAQVKVSVQQNFKSSIKSNQAHFWRY